MQKNSFTISEEGGKFKSQSHNLTDCVGNGLTEQEALDDMVKQMMYVKDNDRVRWASMIRRQVEDLKKRGEVPLAVYNSRIS